MITRVTPSSHASARKTVESYLLGGDVTEAELETALRHALACPECRATKPVSALLASSKAAPPRPPAAPVGADLVLAAWDGQGAEAAIGLLDKVTDEELWSWLLEPEPAMGGGDERWRFYRLRGGPLRGPEGTVDRVADETRLTVHGLPAQLEGTKPWLLVPSLRASEPAGPPVGRFEAVSPAASGSATFALGDAPADAQALGPVRIVAAPAARG